MRFKKGSEPISTTIMSIPILILLVFGLLLFGIFTSILMAGKGNIEIKEMEKINIQNQQELIRILNYPFEDETIKEGIIRWNLDKDNKLKEEIEEKIEEFFAENNCDYLFCAQIYGTVLIRDRIAVSNRESLFDERCEQISEEGLEKINLKFEDKNLNFYYYSKC